MGEKYDSRGLIAYEMLFLYLQKMSLRNVLDTFLQSRVQDGTLSQQRLNTLRDGLIKDIEYFGGADISYLRNGTESRKGIVRHDTDLLEAAWSVLVSHMCHTGDIRLRNDFNRTTGNYAQQLRRDPEQITEFFRELIIAVTERVL
jgi:hypothetical protein